MNIFLSLMVCFCLLGIGILIFVILNTRTKAAAREDRLESLIEKVTDEKLSKIRELLAMQIKLDAADSFAEISSRERLLNIRQIDSILSPLKENIENFRRATADADIRSEASGRSMQHQISELMEMNRRLAEESRRLSQALKGDSKVQGDWGETVLARLLEDSGLTEGTHFRLQATVDSAGNALKSEDGKALRPDALVNLPGGKTVIIDSKVSLRDYLSYCGADSREEAEEASKRHLSAVKRHIDTLASREYHKNILRSFDMVIMFIPNEGAFLAAVRTWPEIINYASSKGIVLASSAHLVSLLQIIASQWRDRNRDDNAAEIARLGGLLYDKVVAFATEIDNVGRNIDRAADSLKNARDKLIDGRQSVMARAQRLRRLGARTSAKLPSSFTENLDLSDEVSEPSEEDQS